jgi:hypothetical protein
MVYFWHSFWNYPTALTTALLLKPLNLITNPTMRSIYFLIFSVLFLPVFSWAQPCTTPMSNAAFQQGLARVKTAGSELAMSQSAALLANQCLSSAQVKAIVLLLPSDQSKYDFALMAFSKTVDKVNFYDVYDGFAYFSTVFRLHDATATIGQPTPQPEPTKIDFKQSKMVVESPKKRNWPALGYPSIDNYLGNTGCIEPMPESDFDELTRDLPATVAEDQAQRLCRSLIEKKQCLSTAQIMKLSTLMNQQQNRLNFFKDAINIVYDEDNYARCGDALTLPNLKRDFSMFINGRPSPNEPATPATPACSVSAQEQKEMIDELSKIAFSNTKSTVARQVIASKKCFTTAQIMEVLNLFSFEQDKLNMAFCIDKGNYFKINSLFSYSSSKEELTRFVSNAGQ